MGRPEPCVLFAQTFVHPHLDEYVDEVSFVEPVVITACEFLEQNASSASSVAKLMGATFPPSFALEVFVQCEGETRFRRLCHPFLYSHSSSNVLEVEAIVTSHLVVRGSYRSLSLVIHGNTAGDLGQFNIEVDLDTSLTDLVCSTEGKLDDLPPALQSKDSTIEKLITPDNVLSLPVVPSDISIEIKKLLQLIFKILELSRGSIDKVTRTVTPVAFSYAMYHFPCAAIYQREFRDSRSKDIEEVRQRVLEEGVEDLHDFCRSLESIPESNRAELSVECSSFESEADLVTSKQLMEMLNESFYNRWNPAVGRCPQFSQEEEVTMWLAVALLLCSGREGCFHFVTGGGMESLASVLRHDLPDSTAITLLLLAVIESATRYSVGCEGFLGWWPREDDSIPSSISEGYSQLLKLLLHKQRHDVASLATHILHRLRLYEVASKYECAVLSVLGSISGTGKVTDNTLDMLIKAKSQLKNLLELTNTCGPIEDPSSVACASRSLIIGQSEGLLSYDTTCSLLASSICQFFNSDLDLHLLSLLKERGFLPLSAALLSSLILHSEVGRVKDIYMDIVSLIEALILSLLFCRSGLIFLLLQPELCVTLVHALRGVGDINKEDFVPLRYASVLVRKGFFCRPREIGVILEMHLRVVCAIDRLLMAAPSTEEFLWVLWELCDVSRSDCGRQALLAVVHFPEAVSVLIEALHSVKDSEEVAASSGTSPINLAILHSAAEICEVIVTDSTVLSLLSWIEHAMELHKALHSASPGSNRKDTPTRLLEWIDAGVVYHKNGAIGLLIYGSVLASGGDAHLSSTSILVSDSVDLESAVGDSSSSSDVHVIENLVKLISEKSFDGVALRDSSIAQLTTTFRILAFISESPVVAAALYDEGAVTVICAVLINCGFMLERSSNNYDYLIDEGTECNPTSDLLLERYREQSLVDLLVPCLILLINLLQKLQEAKEQHRNSKLMNALLRLHREVSSKLAACAENLSSPYSDTALGFGAVCHLLVSALACWPVYGWAPGLFHSLLSSVEATSLLAPGLKETCSLMCVLNDIFPEEGVWLWKNGMPLLSGLRSLAVATILGPRKERQVNWYLLPKHLDTLLSQLRPHLEKIAQIILHYAITSLVVVQDLLRVFIVRMACRKAENAVVLLRPVTSWIHDHLSESSSLKDTESYKVYRVLDFLGSLLEHPYAKSLLLKENVVHMLADVLERVISSFNSDGKEFSDDETSTEIAFSPVSWCIPVFKSFVLICDTHPSLHLRLDKHNTKTFSAGDYSLILCYIIRFCQVLPVGKELLACLIAFKELGSCSICQSALTSIFSCNGGNPELHGKQERDANYNLSYKNDWAKSPPLLCCWKKLLRTAGSKDGFSSDTIEAVSALSLGALHFSMDAKSLNLNRVAAVKFLFGIPCNVGADDDFSEENIKYIKEMIALLNFKISDDDNFATADTKTNLLQALECAESLLLLMKRPTSSVIPDDKICSEDVHLLLENVLALLNKHGLVYDNMNKVDDSYYVGGFDDKFIWECQTVPDRLSQVTPSVKKKLSSGEVPSRRARGDNSPVEVASRGQGLATAPPGLTRRDTFRQRKPNTSRPPSMHVDDYVARERNTDVHASSNVIAVQRVGSSGRPPSIHVDEFIARQKERQNLVAMAVGKVTAQSKSAASENNQDAKELEKSEHLKADIDDDLQGIDIVFDAEGSESDDKLPFPQLDDNLQQPGPLIVEQNSPRSIVEETECDVNETAHSYHLPRAPASTVHDSIQSESSLRPSEDPICFFDKKLTEQSDDSENAISMKASASPGSSGFLYRSSASPAQLPASINRYPPRPHFYPISSPQETGHASPAPGPQGSFDQIFHSGQPPLPPMPPPPAIANLMSQKLDKVPSQPYSYANSMKDGQPVAFHGRSEFVSGFTGISVLTSSAPGASSRPLPPLPPTPPPSASTPIQTVKSSVVQSPAYNNQASVGITQPSSLPSSDALLGSMLTSGTGLNAYPPAPFMRLLGFSRPASPMPQQGSSSPHILPNLCISQSSIQPIQPLAQLQPLQPPQLPRPPQPPQYPRPAIQQPAQVMASPLQQPIQILQPPQASPLSAHFRSQGEESSSEVHAHQQGEESALQPSDSAMSLQQHFSSPEAIQSLLSDRDKLCQLLEQHPKLMQMLQERLGQL